MAARAQRGNAAVRADPDEVARTHLVEPPSASPPAAQAETAAPAPTPPATPTLALPAAPTLAETAGPAQAETVAPAPNPPAAPARALPAASARAGIGAALLVAGWRGRGLSITGALGGWCGAGSGDAVKEQVTAVGIDNGETLLGIKVGSSALPGDVGGHRTEPVQRARLLIKTGQRVPAHDKINHAPARARHGIDGHALE